MIHFDIKDGKLIVKAELLTVPLLREIYERDESKNKATALKELLYIFHMGTTKGPYADLDEEIKEAHVKKAIFKSSKHEVDAIVQTAIDEYILCTIDSIDRMLFDFNKKVDEVRKVVMESKTTDANISSIIGNMNKMDDLLATKEKIQARMEKTSVNTKTRANVKMSFAERKGMRDNPNQI